MSIKYSVTPLPHPVKTEEPPLYYAKAQVREVLSEDNICSRIAFITSLSEGDVRNVIRSLGLEIRCRLSEGDLVNLGSFGSFQYQLQSEGTRTRGEFNLYKIKRAKLQFRPGSLFKVSPTDLKFEEVIPVKLRDNVKRELKKQ